MGQQTPLGHGEVTYVRNPWQRDSWLGHLSNRLRSLPISPSTTTFLRPISPRHYPTTIAVQPTAPSQPARSGSAATQTLHPAHRSDSTLGSTNDSPHVPHGDDPGYSPSRNIKSCIPDPLHTRCPSRSQLQSRAQFHSPLPACDR